MSVCAESFSIYFNKHWIAHKTDIIFLQSQFFSSFIARTLPCNGLLHYWSILCRIHSISVLNSSKLSFWDFSSFVGKSNNSSKCFWLQLLITTMISSDPAGCLFSSVWFFFSRGCCRPIGRIVMVSIVPC